MEARKSYAAPRVGLFAIGLAAYWEQFPDLKTRLESAHRVVAERVGEHAEVVGVGLVDDAQSAAAAADHLAGCDLDLLICHAATYATSSQVLPIARRVGRPVLVLSLQPVTALDYASADTGEWLANGSSCCVPEIAHALHRAGIAYTTVSGRLHDDARAWETITAWCRAAQIVRVLKTARIGFLGHTYPGMLDMYSDFTQHHAQLGTHIEVLEMCDLMERVERVSAADAAEKQRLALETFTLDESVRSKDLDWSCRVAAGLDRLVDDFALDGLAYYYRGGRDTAYERLAAGLILGNSLLTANGVPCAGEGDLKNAVAMKMMDVLGVGGSYTEFYAMDFDEGFVLMGHDGPGHLRISDRKPILRDLSLYHGKSGSGVSVEFNVRTGPVTILACTQTREGDLSFLAAEGESLTGPILRIGNTNSRIRFGLGPAEFVDAWCAHAPTHHCALGIGHVAATLEKACLAMGLAFNQVG